MQISNTRIGVVGLGYVGLPLAVEFAKHYPTIGFDIRPERVSELGSGCDSTLEVSAEELANAGDLTFTADPSELKSCNVYIITVPTPIDAYKRPDLTPLQKASETVGRLLQDGDVVIYESTVYPGATEEFCVPILESHSGLSFAGQQDHVAGRGVFHCGYSPERINPGDKSHRLTSIRKVTSGSTAESAEFVDQLYKSVITAGTHLASSIRVAEAAKVIENTQRDVNIALVNELAMLFNKLGIDTLEVLEAAGTKWNFLPFRPGLVGGHCIGVDPYYLTHKAQEIGIHPEVILAGRRINDRMGEYVAGEVIKLMACRRLPINGSRVLIFGLTFKENCPDLRNTRVTDIIGALEAFGCEVDVHDPWVRAEDALGTYGIALVNAPERGRYDAMVLAVGHSQFRQMGVAAIRALGHDQAVLYDVKYVLPVGDVDGRL